MRWPWMMNLRRWRGAKRFGRPRIGLGVALAAVPLVAVLPCTVLAAESGGTGADARSYGLWSIIPPLLAISLAIATRRIHLSLLAGVLIGAWIVAGTWNPLVPLVAACKDYLWPALIGVDHLQVFIFTLAMGAMVGTISRSGGMLGLVNAITPWASNRRRGQLTGWGLGLVVFFDDYANTLLLGNTLRPISDRLKISREKLAYVVDSTAAPVAGLALISTWIAIEVNYIDAGYNELVGAGKLTQDAYNAFDVFIETIPYRFYPLLALVFVVLVAALARDFGPMLTAERRAARGKKQDGVETASPSDMATQPDAAAHWFNAMIPVGVVLVLVLALILLTGREGVENKELPVTFWNLFTQGNSYVALMYGALAGWLAIVLLAGWQRLLSPRQMHAAAQAGAWVVVPALAILWLAWSLQAVSKDLQTAQYVGQLLHGAISPGLLPTLVFLLSAAVAFATGTSWATMGILTPIVVPVSFSLLHHSTGVAPSPSDPLLLASIGSVLAGAIFGDHCSPISDTTVLSSAASGCDHVAHVWTQMPYAMVVGVAAIVCGTLPAGLMAISPWGCVVCLVVGGVLLGVFLYVFGRKADEPTVV